MTKDKHYHWSHGPHYQFDDAIVFLTWRLAFTLPKHLLQLFHELSQRPQREVQQTMHKPAYDRLSQVEEAGTSMLADNIYLYNKFLEYDLALAKHQHPGFSLNQSEIAHILKDALHSYEGSKYELHAYTIMSNHVHLLIRAHKCGESTYYQIADIVKGIKRYTARAINQLLQKEGQVWDRFYFDRIIRDVKNYANVLNYILHNPVAAGLVQNEADWRDSFHNPMLSEKIR